MDKDPLRIVVWLEVSNPSRSRSGAIVAWSKVHAWSLPHITWDCPIQTKCGRPGWSNNEMYSQLTIPCSKSWGGSIVVPKDDKARWEGVPTTEASRTKFPTTNKLISLLSNYLLDSRRIENHIESWLSWYHTWHGTQTSTSIMQPCPEFMSTTCNRYQRKTVFLYMIHPTTNKAEVWEFFILSTSHTLELRNPHKAHDVEALWLRKKLPDKEMVP